MTTPTTVSPLRQRMIEDMIARRLVPGTQVGHIRACKRFAAWLKRSPDTATADDLRSFQLHLTETGVSATTRNRTMTGLRFLFRVTLRRLDLLPEMYHVKEPQKVPLILNQDEARASAGDDRQRAQPAAAQHRLRRWPARRRGRPAQGQAHRQRADDHSRRAEQGPERPTCHAVARDACAAAGMVAAAHEQIRPRRAHGRALAVSRSPQGAASDAPAAQPAVPRSRRYRRHHEGRQPARASAQLCHAPL